MAKKMEEGDMCLSGRRLHRGARQRDIGAKASRQQHRGGLGWKYGVSVFGCELSQAAFTPKARVCVMEKVTIGLSWRNAVSEKDMTLAWRLVAAWRNEQISIELVMRRRRIMVRAQHRQSAINGGVFGD